MVCTVHDVTASREKPKDNGQHYHSDSDVQDIEIPPFCVDYALFEIVTHKEEEVEVETSLNSKEVEQMRQSAQYRNQQGYSQIENRPVKQPFWGIVQHDEPINQAHQIPQDAIRK